jgi:hypothetical protein
MSITYEINNSSSTPATKNDIPIIIGKGAKGIKSVLSKSWNMYDRIQNSDKKIDEDKPKLRIILNESNDNSSISVKIESESEIMRKIAKKSLENHIKFINSKKQKNNIPYEFIIEFPHRLIGKFIGKKASNLNDIIKRTLEEDIDDNDHETISSVRLKVIEHNFTSCKEIIDYSNQDNKIFLGWPPSIDDKYYDHISIKITFKFGTPILKNRDSFISIINSIIAEKINDIRSLDQQELDEIDEFFSD